MGGSLIQEEIEDIKSKSYVYNNIKNFVETGTYKGDSAYLRQNFLKMYIL